MNGEQPRELLELCYILNKRNVLNNARSRAKGRRNYYSNLIEIVYAHKGESPRSKSLKKKLSSPYIVAGFSKATSHELDMIESRFNRIRNCNPPPTKWMAGNGVQKLRSLILKASMEEAQAKYKTAELTLKSKNRLKALKSCLTFSISYSNGYVCRAHVSLKDNTSGLLVLLQKDIEKYAQQYEADKAVEKMLSKT